MQNVDIHFLRKWQIKGKKIAIYCAGRHGILFSRILNKCGITIDCFFDNNPQKWNTIILENIVCLNPKDVENKEKYIVFICIDSTYYQDVFENVKKNGFLNIVNFNDIIDDIIENEPNVYFELIKEYAEVVGTDLFYNLFPNQYAVHIMEENIVKNRIAVYTGVFGDYDDINVPKIFPDNIDYYFVSDNKPELLEVPFQWIDAKEIIPPNIITPIKKNRYIKMHPHLLFPNYKYSIYIDGNIEVLEDISSFINTNRTGISVFMHPKRDCIFYEGITIVNFRRVVAEDVCKQMRRYLEEGMPLHYGMPEMPIIAREHNKPECIKLMEEWWQEFGTGAQRDQLSFMYVMWKNGFGLLDVTSLGNDVRKCKKITINKHYRESKLIVNEGI